MPRGHKLKKIGIDPGDITLSEEFLPNFGLTASSAKNKEQIASFCSSSATQFSSFAPSFCFLLFVSVQN